MGEYAAEGDHHPQRRGGSSSESSESQGLPRSEVLPRAPSGMGRTMGEGGTIWKDNRVIRERVLVRVYDLGTTFVTRWHNEVTTNYGAFHTGVEVYGREWSFGMTFDNISTGVTSNLPCKNTDHVFRETLSMGYTTLSEKQVKVVIEEMRRIWKGHTYNVLSRNCHNFSDTLCQKLGVARLPGWVNDLASTGAQTVEYLDRSDSGYDGGKALVDFFGSMKNSMYATFMGAPTPNRSPAEEEVRRRVPRLYNPQDNVGRYPADQQQDHPQQIWPQAKQDERLTQHNPFAAMSRR